MVVAGQGSFRRDCPYNALPPLPPRARIETERTLKATTGARVALAELRGAGRQIPNPDLLLRSAVLQEAKYSSEIENIVTTNDDLYRAMSHASDRKSLEIKEVLNYQEALWQGVHHLRSGSPLSTSLFCRIASTINNHDTDVRKHPGTRIANPATRTIIYSPPEGESLLRELLHNLSDFYYAEDDLDPLIRMAVAHYQFEAIHPFHDGNGRTGRILNILWILAAGLLDSPALYLSGYILRTKAQYYRGLIEVTEHGKWEEWILYVLDAVEKTATETRRRLERIAATMEEAKELVRLTAPRLYRHEVIELIFEQPYTRPKSFEERGLAERHTASKYLRRLVEIGLLEPVKVWRETLYLNRPLLALLSDPLDESA